MSGPVTRATTCYQQNVGMYSHIPDEEHRMQQRLAEQTAEVRQYTADRRVNQHQVHQQERAELDSNSIPRAPPIAYRSPPVHQGCNRRNAASHMRTTPDVSALVMNTMHQTLVNRHIHSKT